MVVLEPEDWKVFRAPKRKKAYIPKSRKTKMPDAMILKELIWKMSLADVAVRFGVGDTAVQKWLNKLQLDKPPYGYWIRRHSGWTHEEALNGRIKNPPIPRKFTHGQIVLIRQRIAAGEKLLPLAKEYQVCHKTMRDIRDRVRYKEII